MMNRGLSILIGLMLTAAMPAPAAYAGVVVLSNETDARVQFNVIQPDGRSIQRSLERSEAAPVPADADVALTFEDGGQTRRHRLRLNGIYRFRINGDALSLVQDPIPAIPDAQQGDYPDFRVNKNVTVPSAARKPDASKQDVLVTIPVKLVVDDKEPTVRRLWEKRYRDRLAEASAIIERYCPVRFEVVAIGTWTSAEADDLAKVMAEFERTVSPAPARLAIGFTGQYESLMDDKHLGGTRGPFRSHILIREWGRQIAEAERLEILVHELGHFLGAVHSPEPQSVMRPDLSDRQSRRREFRIGFDAPNTLAIYLVGRQWRDRPPTLLCRLPKPVKDQLREVYGAMAAAMPDDPAAPQYLALLNQSLGLAGETPERLERAILGARKVVQAVAESARQNHARPESTPNDQSDALRRSGDALTEYYVRQAAAAARRLPENVAPQAFLLALGVALDDSSLLSNAPIIGDFWRQIEPTADRTARLAVLGSPTMHARRDLTQHFALAASLSVLIGPQRAEGAGIAKEIADSQGGTGFSFADLAADLAGIQFAEAVQSGRIPLRRVEEGFAVRDFLPETAGAAESIAWSDFVQQYGYPPDARLQQQRQHILSRILSLPGYRISSDP